MPRPNYSCVLLIRGRRYRAPSQTRDLSAVKLITHMHELSYIQYFAALNRSKNARMNPRSPLCQPNVPTTFRQRLPVENSRRRKARGGLFRILGLRHFTARAYFSNRAHLAERNDASLRTIVGRARARGKILFPKNRARFVSETVWSASVREQMLGTHEWR